MPGGVPQRHASLHVSVDLLLFVYSIVWRLNRLMVLVLASYVRSVVLTQA